MKSTHNTPLWIAIQRIPSIIVGFVGASKTKSVMALTAAMSRRFIHMNVATHLPEDFSGFPTPDHKAGVTRMLPPSWVEEQRDGKAVVLFDEAQSGGDATLAGLLTVLSDRLVGDTHLHEDTILVGACNPKKLAPNSRDFAASVRNRFFWWDWKPDYDAWYEGLRNGCEWKAPEIPLVPDNWKDYLPQWGSAIEMFLRSAPEYREVEPKDELTRSFPSLRTWHYVAEVCASASALGYSMKHEVQAQLVEGCVGEAARIAFMQFIDTRDLVDAESILEGVEDYQKEQRADLNIALATALIDGLRTDNTGDRWHNAGACFRDMSDQVSAEPACLVFKQYMQCKPEGHVPEPKQFAALVSHVQD